MDDSCSIFSCDVVCVEGSESTVFGQIAEIGKQRLVIDILQLASLELFDNLVTVVVLVVIPQPFAGHYVGLIPVLYFHIVDIRTQGEGKVGRQRPRCGCPSEKKGRCIIFEFEFHGDGGIVNVFIPPEVEFVIGKDS